MRTKNYYDDNLVFKTSSADGISLPAAFGNTATSDIKVFAGRQIQGGAKPLRVHVTVMTSLARGAAGDFNNALVKILAIGNASRTAPANMSGATTLLEIKVPYTAVVGDEFNVELPELPRLVNTNPYVALAASVNTDGTAGAAQVGKVFVAFSE